MKFQGLIQKYSKEYIVKYKAEAHWDGPDWVEGEEVEYQIKAAIFPINAEEVQRYEGLGYTTHDIKMFVPEALEAYNIKEEEHELIVLRKGDTILYKNNKYILDSFSDRTTHSDFFKWFAVRDQKKGDSND